jgi:hypothetical protein
VRPANSFLSKCKKNSRDLKILPELFFLVSKEFPNNFLKRFFILALFPAIITSCDSLPIKNSDITDIAVRELVKAAQPEFNEFYLNQAPLLPADKGRFPIANQLPGAKFIVDIKKSSTMTYDLNGKALFLPGDYTIPVMTYCMNASGASPDAPIYALSQLQGRRAYIIRQLNLKALNKFIPNDVQILSWSFP